MRKLQLELPARGSAQSQNGAALVIGLLLLLVLTILAISGMTSAMLELQMAGNEQYQERAFHSAEAGIERAIARGVYNTSVAIGTWNQDAGGNWIPERGTGTEDCTQTLPDSGTAADSDDCYEYFMRFDDQAGTTTIPGGGYSLGSGFEAYHFEIQSFGTSGRGAASDHTQSVYIVGPGGT